MRDKYVIQVKKRRREKADKCFPTFEIKMDGLYSDKNCVKLDGQDITKGLSKIEYVNEAGSMPRIRLEFYTRKLDFLSFKNPCIVSVKTPNEYINEDIEVIVDETYNGQDGKTIRNEFQKKIMEYMKKK